MTRPVLDTQYELDGDPHDTRDALEGPPAKRQWASRVLAIILAAASIYAAVRGFTRYSPTAEEVNSLSAIVSSGPPKKLPTKDDLGGLEPQTMITSWLQQNVRRLAADKLHLWSAYGLMLLCPAGLACAAVVWWRGQFTRPHGAAVFDPLQLTVALSTVIALAAVRGFDTYTLMSLAKMPPAMDFKSYVLQVRDERRPERFAILREKFQQNVAKLKDKKEKPSAQTDAARRIQALLSRKEFGELCPDAEKTAIVATLKELVKANYADDGVCPPLIRSIGAVSSAAEVAVQLSERERTKPTWIDIKSPAALKFLFTAVSTGDEVAVRQLIQRGINLNAAVPGEGRTALHQAVAQRDLKMVRMLLDARARTDVAGRYGSPRAVREFPLHRAVNEPALLRLLLERGANPNVGDDGGLTPLHRAAASGNAEAAEVLLQHKAQADLKDKGGRKPRDLTAQIAAADKRATIRDLLDRHAAHAAAAAVAAKSEPKPAATATPTATTPATPGRAPVASTPRE